MLGIAVLPPVSSRRRRQTSTLMGGSSNASTFNGLFSCRQRGAGNALFPEERHPAGVLLTPGLSEPGGRAPAGIAPPPTLRAGVPAQGAGRALVYGAASRLRLRLRSLTHTLPLAGRGLPALRMFAICSEHGRRRSLILPLRRRSHRLSTLHAKGLLSPRPARRQIRRGNPDDGAPRPPRRRLRHLGHPPPRSPALRRLLRRPRLSRPAPR